VDNFFSYVLDNNEDANLRAFDYADPSTWPCPLHQATRNSIIDNGPKQIICDVYPRTEERRGFHKEHFTKGTSKTSNETQHREWLLYSKSTDSLFCFPCSLFAPRNTVSPFFHSCIGCAGFKDFVDQGRAIRDHEGSQQHFLSTVLWQDCSKARKSKSSIICEATAERRKQINFWKEVLKSILDAVLFLAKNNLAFRGSNEKLGQNGSGNFLSVIELLSHYHAPLALHIERLKPGSTSYLFPPMQNELIGIAASSVRAKIMENIKSRTFFAIMFDATPDSSHHEQISQVIRAVRVEDSLCYVEENFIDFINFEKKTGAELSKMIVQKLEKDGLNIENWRARI